MMCFKVLYYDYLCIICTASCYVYYTHVCPILGCYMPPWWAQTNWWVPLVRVPFPSPLAVPSPIQQYSQCRSSTCTRNYTTQFHSVLCHFVATCLLPTLPSYRSASVISYASKKLSEMADNSVSSSLNSWWIDELYIAIKLWQLSCKYLFPFLSYNTSNN